jgi:large subunit ribosomal protein L5e
LCWPQTLAEEEPEKFQSHFSEYIKKGVDADGIESLYKKVHAAIRADATIVKSNKPAPKEHKRYPNPSDNLYSLCP